MQSRNALPNVNAPKLNMPQPLTPTGPFAAERDFNWETSKNRPLYPDSDLMQSPIRRALIANRNYYDKLRNIK